MEKIDLYKPYSEYWHPDKVYIVNDDRFGSVTDTSLLATRICSKSRNEWVLFTSNGVVLGRKKVSEFSNSESAYSHDFLRNSRDVLSRQIAIFAAKDPEICGHIPADVYQSLPTLSQEILTEYQKRVLEENAAMSAGDDRTPLVERVKAEVSEMNRVFDNMEKSKSENLFADVSFERKK